MDDSRPALSTKFQLVALSAWMVVFVATCVALSHYATVGRDISFRPWVSYTVSAILIITALVINYALIRLYLWIVVRYHMHVFLQALFSIFLTLYTLLSLLIILIISVWGADYGRSVTYHGATYYRDATFLGDSYDLHVDRNWWSRQRIGEIGRRYCYLPNISPTNLAGIRVLLDDTPFPESFSSDPTDPCINYFSSMSDGEAVTKPVPSTEDPSSVPPTTAPPEQEDSCEVANTDCIMSVGLGAKIPVTRLQQWIRIQPDLHAQPIPGSDYSLATMDEALGGKRWIMLVKTSAQGWEFVAEVPTLNGVSDARINAEGEVVLTTPDGVYRYRPANKTWVTP